jgi:hypothetical protein
MHKAIIGTIVGTTILSVLAALALVGMQPYQLIDSDSAFGLAFDYNGAAWAAQLVRIGEIVTLPVVVLISFLAQPRLQYAMAQDGLLPSIFAKVDSNGNLFYGTLIGGIICTLIAILVPFDNLNDLCSAGVLFTLSMSNAAVLMLRLNQQSSGLKETKNEARSFFISFFVLSGVFSFLLIKLDLSLLWVQIIVSIIGVVLLGIMLKINWIFSHLPPYLQVSSDTFQSPLVPLLPCVSIIVNWILIAQLSWIGIGSFAAFIWLASMSYAFYGMGKSSSKRVRWHSIVTGQGYECDCPLCKNGVGAKICESEDTFSCLTGNSKDDIEEKQSKGEETRLLSTAPGSNSNYLST